ncbi:hypothetical protein D3C73_1076070 [compost metagenome]
MRPANESGRNHSRMTSNERFAAQAHYEAVVCSRQILLEDRARLETYVDQSHRDGVLGR